MTLCMRYSVVYRREHRCICITINRVVSTRAVAVVSAVVVGFSFLPEQDARSVRATSVSVVIAVLIAYYLKMTEFILYCLRFALTLSSL